MIDEFPDFITLLSLLKTFFVNIIFKKQSLTDQYSVVNGHHKYDNESNDKKDNSITHASTDVHESVSKNNDTKKGKFHNNNKKKSNGDEEEKIKNEREKEKNNKNCIHNSNTKSSKRNRGKFSENEGRTSRIDINNHNNYTNDYYCQMRKDDYSVDDYFLNNANNNRYYNNCNNRMHYAHDLPNMTTTAATTISSTFPIAYVVDNYENGSSNNHDIKITKTASMTNDNCNDDQECNNIDTNDNNHNRNHKDSVNNNKYHKSIHAQFSRISELLTRSASQNDSVNEYISTYHDGNDFRRVYDKNLYYNDGYENADDGRIKEGVDENSQVEGDYDDELGNSIISDHNNDSDDISDHNINRFDSNDDNDADDEIDAYDNIDGDDDENTYTHRHPDYVNHSKDYIHEDTQFNTINSNNNGNSDVDYSLVWKSDDNSDYVDDGNDHISYFYRDDKDTHFMCHSHLDKFLNDDKIQNHDTSRWNNKK